MQSIIHFLLMVSLVACQSTSHDGGEKLVVKGNPDYQAPGFTGNDWMEKLTSAFPVVDKIYEDYAIQNHMPSIAYGVIADGQLIHSGAFGETNLADHRAADIHTAYRIASMSKSFTAMAILKLRDEGKLNLQDPAAQYLPALNNMEYATADSPPLTIQHLLTMSSGFPEDNPWGDRQLDDTDEDLLELIQGGLAFANPPGLTYEYSNLGFAMLGNIIKIVSGVSYQQYITDNILLPLGMNDSRWEFSDVPEERMAQGYHWVNEQWQEEPILHDGAYGAMGGLICSIEDFSKYVSFHLSAWPPRNDPETGPVKRSTIREMHQLWRINPNSPIVGNEPAPFVFGYAFGLNWRKDTRGIVRVGHSGGLPGYGSEWRIYPDYGIGVVSFSNRRYGAPSLANANVMDTLVALAQLKPRELPPSKILEQRKAELVDQLTSWDGTSKIFAENFYLDKPEELRRKEIEQILNLSGSILSVGKIVPENQLRGTFELQCEKGNVSVFFTLTPEKNPLIQELTLTARLHP